MLDTPFTPGETLSYTIRGDILDSAPEGTELQLELASFADIIATNSEGKTIVISGEYPMQVNENCCYSFTFGSSCRQFLCFWFSSQRRRQCSAFCS